MRSRHRVPKCCFSAEANGFVVMKADWNKPVLNVPCNPNRSDSMKAEKKNTFGLGRGQHGKERRAGGPQLQVSLLSFLVLVALQITFIT